MSTHSIETGSFETLELLAPQAHILEITLARPQVMNALNTRMARELTTVFEAIALDPEQLRCIIVTGAGERAFCAGADLKERQSMADERWQSQHHVFERMVRALLDCPVPMIGAINGLAYGGGCEIAGCCDFLYAADHARFALPEVTLGFMPGGGGTQTLPRAIGERRAKELILTGRPFAALQAMEWGLVNRVLPPGDLLEGVRAVAAVISHNAPISTRQAKLSIHRGLQMSLRDGLAFEIEAYARLVPTQDRHEGVSAFAEKRAPRFIGR